jgi:hypothetical protein
MTKKLLVGLGPLAVAAALAVPAAQAALPPIKAFPKVFINGVKATKTPRPAIVAGHILLHNGTIGNLECNNVTTGNTFNETTEGTEKGFLDSTGYTTFECTAGAPCKVHNTKGELVEGIYATAEAPPTTIGTETHNAGISSLPWTGEFIERETERKQVLTKPVKIWVVLPPATVGEGTGCAGTEIEFETQEGKTEKENGYELAPIWVNGSKNGLKPSRTCESRGEEGLTEKGFPVTGRLRSPQVGDGFVTTGTKCFTGGMGGNWELVTIE